MISINDLDNPIWTSLGSHHSHLGAAVGAARRYKKQLAPFAGLERYDAEAFEDLRSLVTPYESVALFSAHAISVPPKWDVLMSRQILQMVLDRPSKCFDDAPQVRGLTEADLPQMLSLTARTAPGPFLQRSIDLGEYFGIHFAGELVSMAGERFATPSFTEVSAVCTAIVHRGKGYARALTSIVAKAIQTNGRTPFLHVKGENRALAIYEDVGFKIRRPMVLTVVQPKRYP